MKAYSETSKDIDVSWLCKLWAYRTAEEMADLLHGFHQLTNSNDQAMLDEIRFLQSLCAEMEAA